MKHNSKMKLFTVISATLIAIVSSETPCRESETIDITEGKTQADNSIVHGDEKLVYKLGEYYRNTSNPAQVLGCICVKKVCAKKCCPNGMMVDHQSESCVSSKERFHLTGSGVVSEDMMEECGDNEYKLPFSDYYGVTNYTLSMKEGKLHYTEEDNNTTLVENYYICVDNFYKNNETKIDAFICFSKEQDDRERKLASYKAYSIEPNSIGLRVLYNSPWWYSSAMLVSCVFFALTLCVYLCLPRLRTLHGCVLVAYVACMLAGYLSMAVKDLVALNFRVEDDPLAVLVCITYFSLMSAFFWLNVMSYDLWRAFSSQRRGSSSIRRRFLWYCAYAFSVPAALTALVVGLEYSGLPDHPLLPRIRGRGSFLTGVSQQIYFSAPIAFVWVTNLVFFVLTARHIAYIQRQTSSVLETSESRTNNRHQQSEKQRMILYLKLFTVMGVTWILEVIGTFYEESEYTWWITDAINLLIGVAIFFIFVCKKNIFVSIKKRFGMFNGQSNNVASDKTPGSLKTRLSAISLAITAPSGLVGTDASKL